VSTQVVITGTGIPAPLDPRRAGAGVLVRADDLLLQFDAGRATTLRIAALDLACTDVSAVFLTHHHSDHLIGLDDLLMTRWFDDPGPGGHLPIICPDGPCVRFCERMLDRWDEDLEVRQANEGQPHGPKPLIQGFVPTSTPQPVWRSGAVTIETVAVHHEPVVPSVAYRVRTPSGDVAISGDTRVCEEFAELARGAQVVIHEAMCAELLPDDPEWLPVIDYHAEAEQLGAMAAALQTPVLVLTHLLPPPRTTGDEQIYADRVRAGGFTGEIVVGRDLDRVTLTESRPTVQRGQTAATDAGASNSRSALP
jgi:ribonuclease Z